MAEALPDPFTLTWSDGTVEESRAERQTVIAFAGATGSGRDVGRHVVRVTDKAGRIVWTPEATARRKHRRAMLVEAVAGTVGWAWIVAGLTAIVCVVGALFFGWSWWLALLLVAASGLLRIFLRVLVAR